MIKFFRKIRQNLLMENKTGKYFKYAIGEIVLVVIGILIALQINNWNEKRKINNEIDLVFTALQTELESNILETSGLLRVGHLTDSLRTLFRENKVTREIIRKKPYLAFLSYRTRSTFLEDDRLNEVIEQEKELSANYKSLLPEIKLLKRRIKAWRFWQEKTLELSMQRRKELASKTPWIGTNDSLGFEKIIDRTLNDKIHRSEVNQYAEYQLGENVWEANKIRTSSVVLLWKLKSTKDKNLKIEDFLNHLNLKPFIEFTCGKVPKKQYETYFDRSVIIYNNQNKEVTLKWRYKNNDNFNLLKVSPNSFLDINEDIYIHEEGYFELEKDGKCSKVYDANKEDYIIL
ncbi:DUF6090 family protein [Winogradskyella vincentii]|uniref:Uncharacterized protein n=1 Tax=Winogradskyella vincentii TaxID=2877122 RepID=A0ABS7Y733_9FLAO|nr:DUF6090 family protein [Winogradskyella vincentii]MCA0154412.1 hypothetical protein [Winogradskyella vincentii]